MTNDDRIRQMTGEELAALYSRFQSDNAPTIESEAWHEHWIPLKGWFNKSIVKCSACGNTLDMDGVNAGRGDANFCPIAAQT